MGVKGGSQRLFGVEIKMNGFTHLQASYESQQTSHTPTRVRARLRTLLPEFFPPVLNTKAVPNSGSTPSNSGCCSNVICSDSNCTKNRVRGSLCVAAVSNGSLELILVSRLW